MNVPIVMLCGNAGAGKDTVASNMELAQSSLKIALADPLKSFAKEVFGFSTQQLYGPSKYREESIEFPEPQFKRLVNREMVYDSDRKRQQFITDWVAEQLPDGNYSHFEKLYKVMAKFDFNKLTARDVLRAIGTDFGRSIDSNLWVNAAIRKAKNALLGGKNLVIITDGRFRNEIFKVKEVGGMVVKIVGDNPNHSNHISEKELDSIPDLWFDHIVHNPKTTSVAVNLKNSTLPKELYVT